MAHLHINLPHTYPTTIHDTHLPTYPPTPPNDFLDPLTETREHGTNWHITHTFRTHWLVHRDHIRATHRLKVYRQWTYLLYQQSKLQFPIHAPCTYICDLGQVRTHLLHSQHNPCYIHSIHTHDAFTAFTRSHTRMTHLQQTRIKRMNDTFAAYTCKRTFFHRKNHSRIGTNTH